MRPWSKSAKPPANFASSDCTPRQTRSRQNKRAGEHAPALFLNPYCPLNIRFNSAVAASFFAHQARTAAAAVSAGDIIADAPQAPAQPLRKLVPRTPQTRLERVFRHAKLLGGLSGGVALDFA